MRRHSMVLGSTLVATLVVGVGCTVPLPRYEWHDARTAVRTMSRRDVSIRTLSAACRILLESEGGRVELTGAFVAQPPHRLRLRAWKFSLVVFDVTVNDDGLFVLDNRRLTESSKNLQRVNHARFVEAITLLPGFELDETWQTGVGSENSEFTITRRLPDQGSAIECIVDKNTLVRKRCVYRDDGGHIVQCAIGIEDQRLQVRGRSSHVGISFHAIGSEIQGPAREAKGGAGMGAKVGLRR